MSKTHKKPDHMFEADLRPGGKGSGFRRLNAETGQEDIRTRPIPTESGLAARLGKIVNSKRRGGKG